MTKRCKVCGHRASAHAGGLCYDVRCLSVGRRCDGVYTSTLAQLTARERTNPGHAAEVVQFRRIEPIYERSAAIEEQTEATREWTDALATGVVWAAIAILGFIVSYLFVVEIIGGMGTP